MRSCTFRGHGSPRFGYNRWMRNPRRKIALVLAAADHGTMIVNRLDYRMVDERRGFGVGFQILEGAAFDPEEVDMALSLLGLRRQYFGDGVTALDCGANIGVHTIEWAKRMQLGYRLFEMGLNLLAIHASDSTATHVKAA
jgi:hypothetical protein